MNTPAMSLAAALCIGGPVSLALGGDEHDAKTATVVVEQCDNVYVNCGDGAEKCSVEVAECAEIARTSACDVECEVECEVELVQDELEDELERIEVALEEEFARIEEAFDADMERFEVEMEAFEDEMEALEEEFEDTWEEEFERALEEIERALEGDDYGVSLYDNQAGQNSQGRLAAHSPVENGLYSQLIAGDAIAEEIAVVESMLEQPHGFQDAADKARKQAEKAQKQAEKARAKAIKAQEKAQAKLNQALVELELQDLGLDAEIQEQVRAALEQANAELHKAFEGHGSFDVGKLQNIDEIVVDGLDGHAFWLSEDGENDFVVKGKNGAQVWISGDAQHGHDAHGDTTTWTSVIEELQGESKGNFVFTTKGLADDGATFEWLSDEHDGGVHVIEFDGDGEHGIQVIEVQGQSSPGHHVFKLHGQGHGDHSPGHHVFKLQGQDEGGNPFTSVWTTDPSDEHDPFYVAKVLADDSKPVAKFVLKDSKGGPVEVQNFFHGGKRAGSIKALKGQAHGHDSSDFGIFKHLGHDGPIEVDVEVITDGTEGVESIVEQIRTIRQELPSPPAAPDVPRVMSVKTSGKPIHVTNVPPAPKPLASMNVSTAPKPTAAGDADLRELKELLLDMRADLRDLRESVRDLRNDMRGDARRSGSGR